jgi:hypothetical protein
MPLFGGCQRATPLSPLPRSAAPERFKKSDKPLDPKRIRGAESFGSSVLLAIEAGIAGDRISTLLEVPKDVCAVVIARGSATVEDLDLLAYGEDGTPLGSDEAGTCLPTEKTARRSGATKPAIVSLRF